MKNKEIINKKSEVITDVICDCCGESCKVNEFRVDNDDRIDNGEPYYCFEFMNLEANWGFHSAKDTQKWTAQVCEKCVDEKFSFIKFKKEQYM